MHGNQLAAEILAYVGAEPSEAGEKVQEWIEFGLDEALLRDAMSETLKARRLLKRVDYGETLSRVVEAHWGSLDGGMKSTIERVEAWAYAH